MRHRAYGWLAPMMLAAGLGLPAAGVFGQTPEQEKMWAAQKAQKQVDDKARAEQLAREREARRADPMAWVRTLDPMSDGGWVFRAVGSDGSWAYFSTDHQLKRSGHTLTAWLRQEFPEPRHNSAGDFFYSSAVERVQYDCGKERSRILLVIYYAGNNLSGNQQSEESDPKQVDWEPIVPGTQSESIFRFTCGAGSAGTRP